MPGNTAILVLGGFAQVANASTTSNFPFGSGGSGASTTEANEQVPCRFANTLSKLQIEVSANTVTATSTLKLRNGAANGNESVSIGNSATGIIQDTTNTDSITAGNLLDYQLVTGGTGTSLTTANIAVLAQSSSVNTTNCRLVTPAIGATLATTSVNYFFPSSGVFGTSNTAESKSTVTFKHAATATKLAVHVSVNGLTSNPSITVTSRVGSANANLTLTFGASATGLVEDTTNSDSLVTGNNIDYQAATGSAGTNATCDFIGSEHLSNAGGNQFYWLVTADPNGSSMNFNTTNFFTLAGDLVAISTEANTQTTVSATGQQATNMTTKVATNSIATSATTILLRQNGVSTALKISVAAGATGTFADTSDIIILASTDNLNYQVATPNTSGSILLRSIAMDGIAGQGAGVVAGAGVFTPTHPVLPNVPTIEP